MEDIELFAVVRPRDELYVAVLRVEREILDVECAVSLDQCRVHPQYHTVTVPGTSKHHSRVHPQHRTVARHDRVRHHVVVELITGTAFSNVRFHNSINN